MSIFRATQSATLVGEELHTAIAALEHSAHTLNDCGTQTPSSLSAISRRRALAARLRRAL